MLYIVSFLSNCLCFQTITNVQKITTAASKNVTTTQEASTVLAI